MVGSFPNWDVWAEWNGRYRDDVRRFLRYAARQRARVWCKPEYGRSGAPGGAQTDAGLLP
jgi:hypothetical protein